MPPTKPAASPITSTSLINLQSTPLPDEPDTAKTMCLSTAALKRTVTGKYRLKGQ